MYIKCDGGARCKTCDEITWSLYANDTCLQCYMKAKDEEIAELNRKLEVCTLALQEIRKGKRFLESMRLSESALTEVEEQNEQNI